MRIGIFMSQGVILISGREISYQTITKIFSIDNVQVRVAIDPWGPLAAKELTVGGVNLRLECFNQFCQVTFIKVNTIFDPEINMLSDVLQGDIDLEVIVSIHIGDPHDIRGANL